MSSQAHSSHTCKSIWSVSTTLYSSRQNGIYMKFVYRGEKAKIQEWRWGLSHTQHYPQSLSASLEQEVVPSPPSNLKISEMVHRGATNTCCRKLSFLLSLPKLALSHKQNPSSSTTLPTRSQITTFPFSTQLGTMRYLTPLSTAQFLLEEISAPSRTQKANGFPPCSFLHTCSTRCSNRV